MAKRSSSVDHSISPSKRQHIAPDSMIDQSLFFIKPRSFYNCRKSSWTIPSSLSPFLVLGDSNISTITLSPLAPNMISLFSFPKCDFSSLFQTLCRSIQQGSFPVSHPKIIILSLGINHIHQSLSSTSRAINKTLKIFSTTFPDSQLLIPLINFDPLLPECQRNWLEQFNSFLCNHHPQLVIPLLPQSLFSTTQHNHTQWNTNTANLMLQHWIKYTSKFGCSLLPMDESSFLNLSHFTLDPSHEELLSLGLKFVPTPTRVLPQEIQLSLDSFSRRLKLIYHFRKSERAPLPFIPPSSFTPHESILPQSLLTSIDQFYQIPQNINFVPEENNLSPLLRKALDTLSKNNNIIIKPADKGSCIVIQDRTDYITEGLRQLSNPLHYTTLPGSLSDSTIPKINAILNDLEHKQFLTHKQVEYFTPPLNPRPRIFYLLPKIHKPPHSWPVPHRIPPGRPIVSDCGSDTYLIAELIDHYLQPLSTSHPSYIKDSYHFMDIINSTYIPTQSYLITLDVDAMYTNIDNSMGLQAVRTRFLQNPDPLRPDQQILDLLDICLSSNDFVFNNQTYLQISGTAMGKKFAPSYANIVASVWEEQALSKCPIQPLLYKRFLDDIFIVWPHDMDSFKEFFNILNNHHPSIRLKSTIDQQSVDFLDLTLFKGQRFHTVNLLDTRVFFKPTDKHLLLHKLSFHPPHTFEGVLKSQFLRFYRLSTNLESFHESCNTLCNSLRSRGYSTRFLRHIKAQSIQNEPSNYSHLAMPYPCLSSHCKTCPYFLTHPFVYSSDGTQFPINTPLSCHSTSIIYFITCTKCEIIYIGQTGNSLRDRHNAHLSDIRLGKSTPVALHFNLPDHSIADYKITPLEQIVGLHCKARRLARETHWIKTLKCVTPLGLNIIANTSTMKILPFVIPFSSTAKLIAVEVHRLFSLLQQKMPFPYASYSLLVSYKRRQNIQDRLISASL